MLLKKLKKNKKVLIQPGSLKCIICYTDCPKDGLLSTSGCEHYTCEDCLTAYITHKIRDNKVVGIRCPNEFCIEQFSGEFITRLVGKELASIYEKRVLAKMNAASEIKFCPSPVCFREFKPDISKKYSKCKCGQLICNMCCKYWHEGKTCLEAIDNLFQQFNDQHTIKFCMACKSYVDKVYGCNHVICPVCDYEFCWDCGRQYHVKGDISCPGKWSPLPPVVAPLWNKANIENFSYICGIWFGMFCLSWLSQPIIDYYYWWVIGIPIFGFALKKDKEIIGIIGGNILIARILTILGIWIPWSLMFVVYMAIVIFFTNTFIKDEHYKTFTNRWEKMNLNEFKYTDKSKPE